MEIDRSESQTPLPAYRSRKTVTEEEIGAVAVQKPSLSAIRRMAKLSVNISAETAINVVRPNKDVMAEEEE